MLLYSDFEIDNSLQKIRRILRYLPLTVTDRYNLHRNIIRHIIPFVFSTILGVYYNYILYIVLAVARSSFCPLRHSDRNIIIVIARRRPHWTRNGRWTCNYTYLTYSYTVGTSNRTKARSFVWRNRILPAGIRAQITKNWI